MPSTQSDNHMGFWRTLWETWKFKANPSGYMAQVRVQKLQAAVDTAHAAMHGSEYVGGPSEREAWQTAMRALGEVVTEHKGQG